MENFNEKEKVFLETLAGQIESPYLEIKKDNNCLIIGDNWYNIINISLEQFKLKFSYLEEDKVYKFNNYNGELKEI